jgi:hypothetical protein
VPRRAAVAGAVLLALLAGCGPASAERQPVAVIDARQGPGDVLVLDVASCHGNPSAQVTESPTDVRVAVRSTVDPDAEAACADSLRVQLRAPLGARRLLDTATGKAVAVTGPGATMSP